MKNDSVTTQKVVYNPDVIGLEINIYIVKDKFVTK